MVITTRTLAAMKQKGEKITALTVYDASFSHLMSTAGIELFLVGDSLGSVINGFTSTIPVTVDSIAYHTACVARGNQGALIMADLPFMSYATTEQALHNAAILMRAGAHMVKLEGGAWLKETVSVLTERGIPVCGHLGLTPQSVHQLGGYRVQGRIKEEANVLLEDAKQLAAAGAQLLVLECVPSALGTDISAAITIPTIGIGAGKGCDGQILVVYDMLGLTPGKPFKFTKNFMEGAGNIMAAMQDYINAVKTGTFPAAEHCMD